MLPLKISAAAFLADLTAAKSTSMAAAVVLGFTFVPLAGGGVKPYEVRELRNAIFGTMNTAPAPLAPQTVSYAEDIVDVRPAEARVVRVSAAPQEEAPPGS